MDRPNPFRFMSAGPVMSLTLVALIMTGAVFYYRSTQIQRFIEPALAVFQPRSEFHHALLDAVNGEFGGKGIRGVVVSEAVVRVHKGLLDMDATHAGGTRVYEPLGRAFHRMLSDPETRSFMDVILVVEKVSTGATIAETRAQRKLHTPDVEGVLDALFDAVPELEREFPHAFASSVVTMPMPGDASEWYEFHILPSERQHIEVLQRLQKYAN
jgi:hypothetical protein